MTTHIAELSAFEIDHVSGGALPLLLIAFGKGVLTGATAAGVGIAVLDAFDVVDAF
jgi:hypothetical protein